MAKKASTQKEERLSLQDEMRERTTGYIAASFALVAGLAWNDAVQTLIQQLFPLQLNSIYIKFLYAILITLAVVLITVYLNRLFHRKDK